MGIYRSNSAIYAIIKESTFNTGGTFTDLDVIESTSDTALKPEATSIERKVINNSFLGAPKLAGKITGSGTFGLELIPLGGTSLDLNGADLLEVALGQREEAGLGTGAFIGYSDAGTTVANEIYEAATGETGTSVLYKLSKPCGAQPSLAIKQFLGCSSADSQTITYTGIVPSNVKFNFPVADVATIAFDVAASNYTTAEGESILQSTILTTTPYVGKNAKFTVDNVSYEAKDLSFTIENTVVDREAITSNGVTDKAVTKKTIKGSMSITFENYDELNKFKNNEDASVYLEMVSTTHKFALYMPKIRYTSVNVENADGILENKIEFEGYEDATSREALYIAHM